MGQTEHAWRHSWQAFVAQFAELLDQACSNEELAAFFANQEVTWTGVIDEKLLGRAPYGVRMTMKAVPVTLADGRHTIADYLFLRVAKKDVPAWKEADNGKAVTFRAVIPISDGPFPSLEWADVGEKKGYLSIGIADAVLAR